MTSLPAFRLLTFAVAAAMALTIVSCGGGDTLTAEEYASQMNALCTANEARFDEIGHPESFPEIAAMTPQLVDAFNATLDSMADLAPPDEIADEADRFVELGRQQSALMEDLAVAAGDEDVAAFESVVEDMGAVAAESDPIARSLGATTCTSEA